MQDPEKMLQERTQLREDVMNNRIPKRVPIETNLGMHVMAGYAGLDPRRVYWDFSLILPVADQLCATIPADVDPMGGNFFNPPKAQSYYSEASKMGTGGIMQHPNTHMMEPDEYDELIADPYKFIVTKAVPRVNRALDFEANPTTANSAMHRAIENEKKANGALYGLHGALGKKYGYPMFPRGGGGYMALDILTDELRSFSGMLVDLRRHREKVKEAVEAIYPFNLKHNMPNLAMYNRISYAFYAFHMATYMRPKDFEELWWEPWMWEANDLASVGVRAGGFLETDWTPLLDYIQDMPTGSVLALEKGDIKEFKRRVGSKHVIRDGFPLAYISQLSKEECIDKTKEFLDILAPGGQYIFGFDKAPLIYADINMENYRAVVETVYNYGVYDNPGESTGEVFHKEDYQPSGKPEFKSEAFMTWDKYKEIYPETPDEARPIIESTEMEILNVYYSLLM